MADNTETPLTHLNPTKGVDKKGKRTLALSMESKDAVRKRLRFHDDDDDHTSTKE